MQAWQIQDDHTIKLASMTTPEPGPALAAAAAAYSLQRRVPLSAGASHTA